MHLHKIAAASERFIPALLALLALSFVNAPTWAYVIAGAYVLIALTATAATWRKPPAQLAS